MWCCEPRPMASAPPTVPRSSGARSCRPVATHCPNTRCQLRYASSRPWMSAPPANWRGIMRNVVVTGGSRGIGLAIARNLKVAGYRVIAIARQMNDQLASAMQDAEQTQPGSIHFVPLDQRNIDDI